MRTLLARTRATFLSTIAALVSLLSASVASAHEISSGWGWWLPPNHSEHGDAMDSLFIWIFWLTMIIMIVVFIVMAVFMIKYRYNPNRKKAHFTHGNSRLELAWTIAPAIILALLALFSKKVWDNYRYGPHTQDPGRVQVLVIGEQFKWNIIYSGPDGKLGRYLVFPKPTDKTWIDPRKDSEKKGPFEFPAGITGPAQLPYADAVKACEAYMLQHNKLGKDFNDPDGKDDNWVPDPGRELILPKGRPIEVQLSSKDVIHDFFLPNFRVKLDAVPGMRGKIHFVARKSSTEREAASKREVSLDEIEAKMKAYPATDYRVVITEGMPGTNKDRTGWRLVDTKKDPAKPATIIRHDAGIAKDAELRGNMFKKLRDNGILKLTIIESGNWDLVCEELCGANHYTMQGILRILEQDEFDKLNLDKPYAAKAGENGSKPTPAVASSVR